MTEKVGGNFDLDTVQGQNTFRALLCSMVVHGWGNGMHPFHNPSANKDGQPVEVRVSKDILMSMEDVQSLRYVKKDEQGRVKQALFEPDHNLRVRQQIDLVQVQVVGAVLAHDPAQAVPADVAAAVLVVHAQFAVLVGRQEQAVALQEFQRVPLLRVVAGGDDRSSARTPRW